LGAPPVGGWMYLHAGCGGSEEERKVKLDEIEKTSV
jgi:hypothetical protein